MEGPATNWELLKNPLGPSSFLYIMLRHIFPVDGILKLSLFCRTDISSRLITRTTRQLGFAPHGCLVLPSPRAVILCAPFPERTAPHDRRFIALKLLCHDLFNAAVLERSPLTQPLESFDIVYIRSLRRAQLLHHPTTSIQPSQRCSVPATDAEALERSL